MSHITLSCDLSVKINFSLDSDSKYHEDQEKKGLRFFIGREKVSNCEIQDGRQSMRKPIHSFVFRKTIL